MSGEARRPEDDDEEREAEFALDGAAERDGLSLTGDAHMRANFAAVSASTRRAATGAQHGRSSRPPFGTNPRR